MDLNDPLRQLSLNAQVQEFQPSTTAPQAPAPSSSSQGMSLQTNAQEFMPSYMSGSNSGPQPAGLSANSEPFVPSGQAAQQLTPPQSFQEYHPSTSSTANPGTSANFAQAQEYHPSSQPHASQPQHQEQQQQQHQAYTPQGTPPQAHIGMPGGMPQDPNAMYAPPDPVYNAGMAPDPSSMGYGRPAPHDQAGISAYLEAYQERTRPIQPPMEPLPYMYTVGALLNPHAASKLRTSDSYFMAEDLRRELLSKRAALEFSGMADPNLPVEVDNYHTLVPMDSMLSSSKVFGLPTLNYKAFGAEDGQAYFLRRISGHVVSEADAMKPVREWKKLSHVGMAGIKEAFTTKEFGDSSLVFASEFYPNATTLEQMYLSTIHPRPFDESLLWDYLIQLTAAVRAAHNANLAIRCLDPSKVLVTARNSLIITGVGVHDVLSFDAQNPVSTQQAKQMDLVQLGVLILRLACNSAPLESFIHSGNLQPDPTLMLERVKQMYSADLQNALGYLLAPSQGQKTVHSIMPLIGTRFYKKVDREQALNAVLESELSKELYNGHLFRIMTKLMMVTERPTKDPRFSEGGERYMLKLFKHYVFHQVTKEGEPFLDLAHVVQCLAKLDAASPERVCLMSQDGKNIIVVTYADLNNSLRGAFQELVNATTGPASSA